GFVVPYLIAIFAHGEQADMMARESGYPRRAFTLPVPTAALVGWPMALGIAAVAGFCLVMIGLVLRLAGLAVPVLWPAALAAALAWLEWRGSLFLVPLLAVLVPMPMLFLVFLLSNQRVLPALFPAVAAYPLLIAFTVGTGLGSCHAWARNRPAIPVFLAARP